MKPDTRPGPQAKYSKHIKDSTGGYMCAGECQHYIELNHAHVAEVAHLRMQIGYLAGEMQIAGDKRTTPEIVENAAKATAMKEAK